MGDSELSAALRACRDALQGIIDQGPAENRKGHAPGCQYGYWMTPGLCGDPHSKRCAEAHAAVERATKYLESTAVEQSEMFAL